MHDNLKHLGLEILDVVNLRVGDLELPAPGSIAEPFTVLAELRRQGLIRHLGVSNVSAEQLTEARPSHRSSAFRTTTTLRPGKTANSSIAARGKALHTPPSFPSEGLHSATILLIPGTSSVAHLRENIAAANIKPPADAVDELDRIGAR